MASVKNVALRLQRNLR